MAISESTLTQDEIAEHLDLTARSVRELLGDLGIDHKKSTLTDVRIAYIRRLREQAAGRLAGNGLNLAGERARLSRAQAEMAELNLRKALGEVVPIAGLQAKLSAAIIASREFLLQQPPRLSVLLDGLDRQGREDLLDKTFKDFLRKIASMGGRMGSGHGEGDAN